MSLNKNAFSKSTVQVGYETNLRSEAQIASLHDKIDLLLAMAGEREDAAGAAG